MSTEKSENEVTFLCYECAVYRKPEEMQKYPCRVCGGRKCIPLHTTDENFTCNICGLDNLCNECQSQVKCCNYRPR